MDSLLLGTLKYWIANDKYKKMDTNLFVNAFIEQFTHNIKSIIYSLQQDPEIWDNLNSRVNRKKSK